MTNNQLQPLSICLKKYATDFQLLVNLSVNPFSFRLINLSLLRKKLGQKFFNTTLQCLKSYNGLNKTYILVFVTLKSGRKNLDPSYLGWR